MQARGMGGSCQREHLPISFWNSCLDLQKEKGIQKWAGIVVTSGNRSGTILKDYHWTRNCKSSITFWANAVSQPRNNSLQLSTQSVNIADLEMNSVSL